MKLHTSAICTAAALLALVPAATGQRGIQQITNNGQTHQNPKLSPDGLTVAFRGADKIAVTPFLGGGEITLANGTGLSDFVWSPTSSGLYFLEDGVMKYVPRSGGATLVLAAIPGAQQRLWCVDSQDAGIYGTRLDPVSKNRHIFVIGSNGSGFADIVTSPLDLDQVRIDPSDSKLVYRNYVPTPFSQIDILVSNANGTNPVSVTGGPIDGSPVYPSFVDNGQTVVFTLQSPMQIVRADTAGSGVEFLTQGFWVRRNPEATADGRWVVLQSQYLGGAGPAMIPSQGGGLVVIDPDDTFYLFQSPPTVDESGDRIAFAATVLGQSGLPQLYTVRMDRDLRITPRLEVGGQFTVRLPIDPNESGVILMGAGSSLAANLFTLPNFTYGLALDPALPILPVASGMSGTGNLTITAPIGNDPSFVGVSVFFQGLRVKPNLTGDFTRYAEASVF